MGTRTVRADACQGCSTSRSVARAPGRTRRGEMRAPMIRAARTCGRSVWETLTFETATGRTPFSISTDSSRGTWPLASVVTSPAAA